MNDRYFRCLSCWLFLICPMIVFAQKAVPNKDIPSKKSNSVSTTNQNKDQSISQSQKKADFVRTHYLKGLDHFKNKRYQKALLLFMKVYRIQPNPNLVYNMARSFEELEQYENAANYYEEYLKIHPKANDRDSIVLSIKTLRALGGSKKAEVRKKKDPHPVVGQKTNEEHPQSFGSAWWESKRTWGWVSVGVSSVLLLGGVMYGLDASDANQSMGRAKNLSMWQQSLNERSDAAGVADIFYVTASLSLGTALYLLLSDSGGGSVSGGASKQSVSGGVSVGVGLNAFQFSWSF